MMSLTMRRYLKYALSVVPLVIMLGMAYEVIPVVWREPIVLVIIVLALVSERRFRRAGGLRRKLSMTGGKRC